MPAPGERHGKAAKRTKLACSLCFMTQTMTSASFAVWTRAPEAEHPVCQTYTTTLAKRYTKSELTTAWDEAQIQLCVRERVPDSTSGVCVHCGDDAPARVDLLLPKIVFDRREKNMVASLDLVLHTTCGAVTCFQAVQHMNNAAAREAHRYFKYEQGVTRDVCTVCRRVTDKGQHYKSCGRCRAAYYCSTDCQHVHWPVHKSNCHPVCEDDDDDDDANNHQFVWWKRD